MVTATAAACFWLHPAVAADVDIDPILERMEQGDTREARARLDELAEHHPDHPQVRFLEARLLVAGGDMAAGIERLEALVEEYPELPGPYNNLARLYASEGRMEEARDLLEAGLATSDTYAKLYQNLSTIYVEMARQSYVQALQLEGEEGPNTELTELARLERVEEAVPGAGMVAAANENEQASEPEPSEPEPAAREAGQPAEFSASDMSEEERAAVETLKRWARTWSAQDVDGYLGYYTSDYSPSGMGRNAWRSQRDQRLSAPEWIEVELDGVRAYKMRPDEIIVVAEQDYTSNTYSSLTLKSFTMVRENNGWRIAAEETIRDIVR